MQNLKVKDKTVQGLDVQQLITSLIKEEKGKPIPAGIIVKKLTAKHQELLKKQIYDEITKMIDEGALRQNLKGYLCLGYEDAPLDMSSIKVGTLSITSGGDGFIAETLPDGSQVDYYVNKKHLHGGLKGDSVEFVKLLKEPKNGVYDAAVLNVLERNKTFFVGEYQKNDDGTYNVILDDYKVYQKIELESTENLVDGYKVLLEVTSFQDKKLVCKVVKVIGHKNDVGSDVLSVVIENAVPYEMPEEVEAVANEVKFKITDKDKQIRKDITDRKIISIDPATSKDLDDAVYVKKLDNGDYFLGVSIADVSSYVQPNSVLNNHAFEKGTSVYLVDRVIPMLPHNLSNNICSLNYNELRMALTCDMIIDKNGNFKKIDLYPSIMKNHARFSYDQVNDYYDKKDDLKKYDPEILKGLQDAKELHHILRKKKNEEGYVDFEIDEPQIILDKTGFPVDIQIKQRGTAQKMIEDFMIAANEAVTIKAEELDLPFVFRVHDKPDEKKITAFLTEAKKMFFKIKIDDINNIQPRDVAKWIDDNLENPKFQLLSKLLLRAMQKASYSTNNIGHFGLASSNYTHFTSPIRRYSDLLVHRIFWMFLFDKKSYTDKERHALVEELNAMCEQCNLTETRAIKTERDVNALKFAEYMTKHIGEEFNAIVSSVTSFGLFVELPNTIEGLVSIKNMKDDFYSYDEQQAVLIGRNTNKVYTLGTPVKVRVIGASKKERKIDFELV